LYQNLNIPSWSILEKKEVAPCFSYFEREKRAKRVLQNYACIIFRCGALAEKGIDVFAIFRYADGSPPYGFIATR
jgi:hypothetical protein